MAWHFPKGQSEQGDRILLWWRSKHHRRNFRSWQKLFATTIFAQDFVAQGGIGSTIDENPFKDWTFIVIPYASGDFHTGTGEYHYTQDGTDKTVYHNGYNNYSAFIDEIKAYVGEPDTLLVTGFSAGGFATSLLADDVIGHFPTAKMSQYALIARSFCMMAGMIPL